MMSFDQVLLIGKLSLMSQMFVIGLIDENMDVIDSHNNLLLRHELFEGSELLDGRYGLVLQLLEI